MSTIFFTEQQGNIFVTSEKMAYIFLSCFLNKRIKYHLRSRQSYMREAKKPNFENYSTNGKMFCGGNIDLINLNILLAESFTV